MTDGLGGVEYHAYHADGLGSTRLLTDASGTAATRLWYEAFGETEAQTGNADTDFRYTGEQLDPNLGWYYLRARYMDPARGRFTQMDSFAGVDQDPPSLHKYLYAHASPVNFTDPSGYMSLASVGANLGMLSNLYTIASIGGHLMAGNFTGAAKEIAEEIVYGKLGHLRKVGGFTDQALKFFSRAFGRGVKLKFGSPPSSRVLRENMSQVLGRAPANHHAHHIVSGRTPHAREARDILAHHKIDINAPSNGVFLPGCGGTGVGTIHCGRHLDQYDVYVVEHLRSVGGVNASKIDIINALHDVRMRLLMGDLRLNRR